MIQFKLTEQSYYLPTSYTELKYKDYMKIHPLLTKPSGITHNDQLIILSYLSRCPEDNLKRVNRQTIDTLASHLSFLFMDVPIIEIKDYFSIDNEWFYVKTDLISDQTMTTEEFHYLNEYTNEDYIKNLPKIYSILVRKVVKKQKKGLKKFISKHKFSFEIEDFSIDFSEKNAEKFENFSVSTLYSIAFFLLNSEQSLFKHSLQSLQAIIMKNFPEQLSRQYQIPNLNLNLSIQQLNTSHIELLTGTIRTILNMKNSLLFRYSTS